MLTYPKDFKTKINGHEAHFFWEARQLTYKVKSKTEPYKWSDTRRTQVELSWVQWCHFIHDIAGFNPEVQIDSVDYQCLPTHLQKVARGEATHLGRGNSWNGYLLNHFTQNSLTAVKVTSIVPYVWENRFYLTPNEAVSHGIREHNINATLRRNPKLEDRICRVDSFHTANGKLFLTMPYLVYPRKVTKEHIEFLYETLTRMHRLGWAYLDQKIGWGLCPDTENPLIYDLSTVRHRNEAQHKQSWVNWVEDDNRIFHHIYNQNKVPFSGDFLKSQEIKLERLRLLKEKLLNK